MANLLCLVCSRELPPGTEPSAQVSGVCAGSVQFMTEATGYDAPPYR